MKMPNLASRNHSGTVCFLSESQVGSNFDDCRELDSCPSPRTPAETSVAAIRELKVLRFMAIPLVFERQLVTRLAGSQRADSSHSRQRRRELDRNLRKASDHQWQTPRG